MSEQSQISPTQKELTPLSTKDKKVEFGATGTKLQQGYLSEDYNYQFVGTRKHDIYDKMYFSDGTVFQTLLSCELPIRSADWKIEAYKDKDGAINEMDDEVAEFVEKNLFKYVDFEQFLLEVLTMLRHGFSVFEKVYKFDKNGNIVLNKLAFRKQKTIYHRTTSDGQPGIEQYVFDTPKEGPNKGKTMTSIPADKLLIFTFRKEGDNYEGLSILRPIYKNWDMKNQLEIFEAVKHERQGVGVPIAYMGTGASANDKQEMLDIVTNVRANESNGIVLPGSKNEGRLFEFANMNASDDSGLDASIKRHDSAIKDIMLGLFMKLGGEGKTGSYGMAESQLSFFILGLESVAKQICSVINKFLIPELVDLNFDTNGNYPKLTYGEIGNVDAQKIVNSAVSLVGAGLLTPDETLEQYLRKLIDLPEKVQSEGVDQETETPEEIDDTELNSLESELDTVSEGETEQMSEIVDDICEVFSEMVATFRQPMSEETKRKISEALKKQGTDELEQTKERASSGIDQINEDLQNMKDEFDNQVSSIRDGIEKLKLSSNKKNKNQIKAQVDQLKKQIIQARQNQREYNNMKKEQKRMLDTVKKGASKEISVKKKATADQTRKTKEAERQQKKQERETLRLKKEADKKALEDLKAKQKGSYSEGEEFGTSTMHTILFDKSKFSKEEALKRAKDHNFKTNTIRETDNQYRIRQISPDNFKQDTFRTIELTGGVQGVIGQLKDGLDKKDFNEGELFFDQDYFNDISKLVNNEFIRKLQSE